MKINWAFAINSDFLLIISLQSNVVDLDISSYEFFQISVRNINNLHNKVAKIKGLESLSLWQKLNFFIYNFFMCENKCVINHI